VIILRQLLRDLGSQKLRTFLTIFGIVWERSRSACFWRSGRGPRAAAEKLSRFWARTSASAWPSLTSIPFEGLGKGRRIRLTEEDMDLVAAKADGLAGSPASTVQH